MTRTRGIARLNTVFRAILGKSWPGVTAARTRKSPGCFLQRAAGDKCPTQLGGRCLSTDPQLIGGVLQLTPEESDAIAECYDEGDVSGLAACLAELR